MVVLHFVSIHAPREGCDHAGGDKGGEAAEFQFTHPGRGATPKDYFTGVVPSVSIHAPREGCDLFQILIILESVCFNSRTPGGVRL